MTRSRLLISILAGAAFSVFGFTKLQSHAPTAAPTTPPLPGAQPALVPEVLPRSADDATMAPVDKAIEHRATAIPDRIILSFI